MPSGAKKREAYLGLLPFQFEQALRVHRDRPVAHRPMQMGAGDPARLADRVCAAEFAAIDTRAEILRIVRQVTTN